MTTQEQPHDELSDFEETLRDEREFADPTGRLVAPQEAGAGEPADLAAVVSGSLPGVDVPGPLDELAERRAQAGWWRLTHPSEFGGS